MNACGACSRPSTTVSRTTIDPSAIRGATSATNASRRSAWSAQRQAPADGEAEVPRAGLRLVVRGDRAAQRDPAVQAHRPDRRLEVLAADVVEVDVDAVRRGGRQQLGDPPVVVVEGRVEAEVAEQQRHLLG